MRLILTLAPVTQYIYIIPWPNQQRSIFKHELMSEIWEDCNEDFEVYLGEEEAMHAFIEH